MLVAAAVSENSHDMLDTVRAMIRSQATPECGSAEFLATEECVIGWATTSDRHAPFPFARRSRRGNLLVATGTPIASNGDIDVLLARALELDAQHAAALLSELEGAYAILHWDSRQRALSIVTDFLGVQPLHIARRPGAFFCSTALRGLTGAGVVDVRPDPGAWGSFFVFGHPLGNRTLVQGIERASGAAIIDVRLPGPTEQRRTHWAGFEAASSGSDPATAPIVDALQRSVRSYLEYGHPGAVLMSGGFDSRLVLHGLIRSGVRPLALVVRDIDEVAAADARLGWRAAAQAGVHAETVCPPSDFYRSTAYARYLARSELSSPPLGVFFPRLVSALRPDLRCMWDGMCVQALRALPGAPATFHAYLEKPSMRARNLLASPSPFRIEWAQAMYEGFARLLKEETAKFPDNEHGVAQFSLCNRTRLRTASNPYRVVALDALPFTPGLTREYYAIAAGLTNEAKCAHRLIHRIYRDYFPEALRVPFISRGRLVNLSGRGSWRYLYPTLLLAANENHRAGALLRHIGVLRPLCSSTEELRALLPEAGSADDYVDERLLKMQPLRPEAMRKLYYWQVGRSLFEPARSAGLRLAATAG
jgi:hypothetical protein